MSAYFCTSLFLVSILGLCWSTHKDGRHPLESLQLTQSQAQSLCDAVSRSRIDNEQLYQWIKVHKRQEGTEEKKPAGCFKVGFTPCVGEPRFPLNKDCGVYNWYPANEVECSSSLRSKRSTRTTSVSLSHAQAQHLCHSIQVLPKSLDEIHYVAITIDALDTSNETAQTPHPSELCVTWAYKPCMSENQEGCELWQKIVKPAKKCSIFHSEDPADHVHRTHLQKEISGSSMSEMEQYIRCKSSDSSTEIKCKILPPGTEIRSQDGDRHLRQKRQLFRVECPRPCCCNPGGCHCCSLVMGPCGFCCPPIVCME